MKNFKTYIFLILVLIIVGVVTFFYLKNDVIFTPNNQDNITSWNFKGDYTDDSDLMKRAYDEIEREEVLLKDDKYTDYQVYVHIANQYHFIGNGKKELKYLNKALSLDADKTGLAWHNIGNLMKRIGAYKSARDAYRKSIEVQPVDFYVNAYGDFMKEYFPDEYKKEVEDVSKTK